MIVKQYRVKRIAEANEDAIYQWQIQLTLIPNWFETHIIGKIFPQHKTMSGSCLTWKWSDGTTVNYAWSLWAHNTVRSRIKKSGDTYVNSRFNRH
jgi:hypothetical protein